MARTSFDIDKSLNIIIEDLKSRFVTNSVAYLIRLGLVKLHENFLSQNVDISTYISCRNISALASDIDGLPGMNLDVVESHFVRFRKFHPTVEIYREAIKAVKAEAAAEGKPVRNPEAALYGKLKQWSSGKWKPETAAAVVPPPSGLKTQKEIEKELYGA